MKPTLILSSLAVILLAGAPAHAISRYNVDNWSCGQVQSTIDAEGAAILRYRSTSGSGRTLYDRYVANGTLCPGGQAATITSIPTATGACPVYACRDVDDDGYPIRRR